MVIGCHWLSLVVIGCDLEFGPPAGGWNLFGFWCLVPGISSRDRVFFLKIRINRKNSFLVKIIRIIVPN
jgi:hypothetical protein